MIKELPRCLRFFISAVIFREKKNGGLLITPNYATQKNLSKCESKGCVSLWSMEAYIGSNFSGDNSFTSLTPPA